MKSRQEVRKMLAVKPAGTLTQVELLALWALRKPGGISRSHSPAAKSRSHFAFPSPISPLPFTFTLSTYQLFDLSTETGTGIAHRG